jgi:hypothetical protein
MTRGLGLNITYISLQIFFRRKEEGERKNEGGEVTRNSKGHKVNFKQDNKQKSALIF